MGFRALFDQIKVAQLTVLADTPATARSNTVTQFQRADVAKSTLGDLRTARQQDGTASSRDDAAWNAAQRALSDMQLQIAGRADFRKLSRELAQAKIDPASAETARTQASEDAALSSALNASISHDLDQGRPLAEALRYALHCHFPDAVDAFERQLPRELKKQEAAALWAGFRCSD